MPERIEGIGLGITPSKPVEVSTSRVASQDNLLLKIIGPAALTLVAVAACSGEANEVEITPECVKAEYEPEIADTDKGVFTNRVVIVGSTDVFPSDVLQGMEENDVCLIPGVNLISYPPSSAPGETQYPEPEYDFLVQIPDGKNEDIKEKLEKFDWVEEVRDISVWEVPDAGY